MPRELMPRELMPEPPHAGEPMPGEAQLADGAAEDYLMQEHEEKPNSRPGSGPSTGERIASLAAQAAQQPPDLQLEVDMDACAQHSPRLMLSERL